MILLNEKELIVDRDDLFCNKVSDTDSRFDVDKNSSFDFSNMQTNCSPTSALTFDKCILYVLLNKFNTLFHPSNYRI